MNAAKEFNQYIAHLSEGLGHADRHAGLSGYCTGLMLPLSRKSVEPMAARVDPLHASARHQALHHFVAKSEWSDTAVMARVRDWVMPSLDLDSGCYWIIDNTGFPKKGKHSVGVARQYCGQLGKQDNCQVAVSLSLASAQGSIPMAYQLYLPKDWAADPVRRKSAGVPETIAFATKPEIALAPMRQAIAAGVPMGVVLADAGYGDETAFRDGITELGMLYAVGIRPATTVWAPGTAPLPPKACREDLFFVSNHLALHHPATDLLDLAHAMGHEAFDFHFAHDISCIDQSEFLDLLQALACFVQVALGAVDVVLMCGLDERFIARLLRSISGARALSVMRRSHGAFDLAQVVGLLAPAAQSPQFTPLRTQGDDLAHGIEQKIDVRGVVHVGFNDKGIAAPTQHWCVFFFTRPGVNALPV